ncbi:hypothetical protein ACTG9Q_15440 [Actinokineospora sp. 24-640]
MTRAAGRVRGVGVAGIGFCTLAAVENLGFQDSPPFSGSLSDLYSGTAGNWIALAAGLISLGFFALFALRLARLTGRYGGWSGAAVVIAACGFAGAFLAAAAAGVRAWAMAAQPGAADVLELHGLQGALRAVGGAAVGAVVVAAAPALRRQGLIPAWLARAGPVVAVLLCLVAVTAAHTSAVGAVFVFASFALSVLWIALVSTSVLLIPLRPRGAWVCVAGILFTLVVLAAGISGAALTAFPGATGAYFSWPLSPPPMAALIGAAYLTAAAAFAAALSGEESARRDEQARGLLVGIIALSVPICAATAAHLGAFDFTRWQSLAWVVLFTAFPAAAATALAQSRLPDPGSGKTGPRWPLTAYALIAGVVAVRLWLGAVHPVPASVPPLGGKVLASWFVFAAALALWQAWFARFPAPAVAIVVGGLPLVWILAAFRLPAQDTSALWAWVALLATMVLLSARPCLLAWRQVRQG